MLEKDQIIKDKAKLLETGDRRARKPVLDLMELVLRDLDSYQFLYKNLELKENHLIYGGNRWDLSKKKNIYVVGAGKAANAMARAIEDILGDKITKGIVIVKDLEECDALTRIELICGGHPLPNKNGFYATVRILELIQKITREDLIIGLISGGSSALMNHPLPGITLEEEIVCTKELLTSGARINDINAVRRHISAVNGGGLARAIDLRGAEMINFIISDGVDSVLKIDPLQPAKFFGTPVAPDRTTFADAAGVIEKYRLQDKIPRSIIELINKADSSLETPKVFSNRIQQFVIQKVFDACKTAMKIAESIKLKTNVLTSCLQGESHEAGTFLACIAKEIATNHQPIAPPCIVIAGGETTTYIQNDCGKGGPSQELALGFALEISGEKGICLVSIDTDGTDGPTEIAGGIVDGTTVQRAKNKKIDVYKMLKAHDSSSVLGALGDVIVTGNTGTNLCDLNIISIL